MKVNRLCKAAALGISLSIALGMFANTRADAEASGAIDKIRDLYAEFQTFKNEEEFRRVGYGRCCKYYQWRKKIEALRGNDAGEFIRSFGILPGELIALGSEYYQGRGNQATAKMWEASVEAVLNPKPAELPIDAANDEPDRVTLLAAGESVSDSQPIQEPTIPDDVSYSIIDSTAIAGIKRSLDVRLNKRVAEDTLHAIAHKLKSQDSRNYDRTFITYYLPGMTVGTGAWATTHFTPELEVKILGLSTEEEKKLSTAPAPEREEIVGRWLDEIPNASSSITIFHEGGKLYVEEKYADGGSRKKELVEKRSSLGRRFDEVGGATEPGDHWILDSRGNLQLHDNDGLIRTAKRWLE